jgi:PAP2 superfamily
MKRGLLFILLFPFSNIIKSQSPAQPIHELNTLLINTVMDDLFNPPIGSRIYAYPNIAFYECIRHTNNTYKSLAGKINGLKNIPQPISTINYEIAATIAFTYTAQSLVGSEYKIADWRESYIQKNKPIADSLIWKNSFAYGRQVADSIVAYSKKDNYLKSRGLSRYVLKNKAGDWQPTPSDYANALEPNWYTIRPFSLKKSSQFSPKEKLVFSKDKNSLFQKNVKDVYNISKKLDSNQKTIAMYWDDNPNIQVLEGHLDYYIHKVSPGGHWVMIAKQACEKNNESIERASLIYTLTTIAIFDGFISCWDEKFKTNLIRPVSVIIRNIDKDWQPLIQTPPFPEFTSGHSVTSNAAAEVLTNLMGNNFAFTDNTELPFGMKARNFTSFYQAAEESSISRVYGGIHYPTTAKISVKQGRAIGKYVLSLLH